MASKRQLPQRPQHPKHSRRITVISSIVFVAVLVCAGVAAYAKYAHQVTDDRSVAAHSFYFSSDFLSESGQTYTLSAGTTQLTVELRNYDDALRWSDDDVAYSYEVVRQNADDSESPFTQGVGAIARKADAGSISTVTIDGLNAGTYKVTATSTGPFAKTLTGTFTIPAESNDVRFAVEDSAGSPYALLTVHTEAYDGTISVSWPADVFPDTTQPAFRDVDTYDAASDSYQAGSCDIGRLGKFGSATYRFFKVDPQLNYGAGSGSSTGVSSIVAMPSGN